MGVFSPVIEALVLPVLDPGHDLPLGGAIAAQLVSDQHTGRSQLRLEQLAEQALGGLLVATALHEDVENEPLMVNRAPKLMLLAGDGDDDLIQVPLVAVLARAPTNAVGERAAKFQTLLPDRLIGHRDAASRQYLFDHAKTERKPTVQPDRVADDLGGVAMPGIKRGQRGLRPAQIPDHFDPRKSGCRST